jgi:RNA polymerase sigma-70 factor, ECF subfamily
MKPSDELLVDEILAGQAEAWEKLIARYEGRLLAFAQKRVGSRADAEDAVQETFIGLMRSLPNFNRNRDLESYLFAIAAHKTTDVLRRKGRTTEAARAADVDLAFEELPGSARTASSIVRSNERRVVEEKQLVALLSQWAGEWARKEDFPKLKIMELVFAKGWPPRRCAEVVGMKAQAIAGIKHQVLTRLAGKLGRNGA